MTTPKPPIPHDPRTPRVTPEQLDAQLTEIFSEDPATLAEEAQQLDRAHMVLNDALKND